MAQHRRTRALRYRRTFRDNPKAAELFREDMKEDDRGSHQHRMARLGTASNHYLNKVEIFFGLTVGAEGSERGNGYLRV